MRVHIDGEDVELTGEDEARMKEALAQTSEPVLPMEEPELWARFTKDEQRQFLLFLAKEGIIGPNRTQEILEGKAAPR